MSFLRVTPAFAEVNCGYKYPLTMLTFADAAISSSSRPLEVRKRPDLELQERRYGGRKAWVIKDPLGLRYVHLLEKEYSILCWLDGRRSLDELASAFQQRFAPECITPSEIQQYIGRLHREGLLLTSTSGQGAQLLRRSKKKRMSRIWATLTNPFSIRFRGVDPGQVLEWLYPLARCFFNRACIFAACVLMLAALLLVTLKYSVFQSRLPTFQDFFGPQNWLLLAVVLSFTKLVHELGHGLACRHYGRECHEIGLLLLIFTPCLYCNVSDSWMLPQKWRRAAIGAAGVFVELTLASLATFGWWFSEAGTFNYLCLQIMFVSSISTVVFNGNPLLKYDGYFILSDLWGIPNLKEQSGIILHRYCAKLFLGIEQPPDPTLPQRQHALLAIYAVASELYRWVVVFSVLWFLNEVLEPYGLKVLGQTAAVISLGLMGGKAVWGCIRFFRVPGNAQQMKRSRVLFSLAALGLLLAGACLIPLPRYAGCPVEVGVKSAATVYVPVLARVKEVLVKPGQHVTQGQLLARCENLDLQFQIAELTGQQNTYEAQLASLTQRRFAEPEAGLEIATVEEALLSVKAQLRQHLHWQDLLELKAPQSGTVLVPPCHRSANLPDNTLPTFEGNLFAQKNREAVVSEGTVFCQIGNPATLEAELYVDQGDIELVGVGQPVYLRLDALPHQRQESQVDSLAKREVQVVSQSLSLQAGGSLAVQTDQAGTVRPLGAVYTALVPLEVADWHLPSGSRGWAIVRTGSQTLSARLWRWVVRTFRFDI